MKYFWNEWFFWSLMNVMCDKCIWNLRLLKDINVMELFWCNGIIGNMMELCFWLTDSWEFWNSFWSVEKLECWNFIWNWIEWFEIFLFGNKNLRVFFGFFFQKTLAELKKISIKWMVLTPKIPLYISWYELIVEDIYWLIRLLSY